MSVRVFADGPLDRDAVIELDGEESHYLARVRRVTAGATIEVLDGRAELRRGEVIDDDPKRCRVRLLDRVEIPAVDPIEIAIGQPEPKAALASVARACEAGATTITLVRCARSQVASLSRSRLSRVLRASQRQCGRPRPPVLRGPVDVEAWLDEHTGGCFAWEAARHHCTPIPRFEDDARRVLVGPEGGLTDAEAQSAREHGMIAISLGPWTLRTEIAVVVAITRLRFG